MLEYINQNEKRTVIPKEIQANKTRTQIIPNKCEDLLRENNGRWEALNCLFLQRLTTLLTYVNRFRKERKKKQQQQQHTNTLKSSVLVFMNLYLVSLSSIALFLLYLVVHIVYRKYVWYIESDFQHYVVHKCFI